VDSGCIDLSLFQEEFEDTKVVIRIRKSKKDRQDNGKRKVQTMIYKKITHKTKDQVTQTPLKTGVNSGAPEG
jgi:small-conductance mechanosensitive channel